LLSRITRQLTAVEPGAKMTDMPNPIPTRRFRPTPAWLIYGLPAVEGLLWLSERWFPKGWTVLIAVAAVGATMLAMLAGFVGSFAFRWRFQFSIRSLLVLTLAVALPCSWLAVEMKAAREQKEAVAELHKHQRLPEGEGRGTPRVNSRLIQSRPTGGNGAIRNVRQEWLFSAPVARNRFAVGRREEVE
jgi:hypothetical protein